MSVNKDIKKGGKYCFLILAILLVFDTEINAQLPQSSHLSSWYMGDSVMFSTSNFVKKLKDLSGNGNDATQNNASSQPQQNTTVELNGHKVITFSGSQYLTNNAPFNSPFTLFFISRQNTITSYQDVIEPNGAVATQWMYSGGKYLWYGENLSSTLFDTKSYHIMTLARNSDSAIFYLDTIKNTKASGLPVHSGTGWTIGKYNADVADFFYGNIAEIILYDTLLSDLEISQVNQYLKNKYSPSVDLGSDKNKNFCYQQLDAGPIYSSYKWSTNDSVQKVTPSQPGKYWVRVRGTFGFISSDTVNVQLAKPNLFKDSANCNGNAIKWDLGLNKLEYTFLWNNNTTDSLIAVTQSGKYHATITDVVGCTLVTDSFNIILDNFSSIATLGPDKTFCSGNSIALTNGASQAKAYLWSNGSTGNSLPILNSGQYRVTVTDSYNCVANDTINITILGVAPKANFSSVAPACNGDSISFTDLSVPPGGNSITNRLWDFGDTKSSILTSPRHLYQSPDTGIFNIKLSVTTNAGCSKDTSIQLHVYPKPIASFSNVLPSCSGKTSKFTNLTNLKGYSAPSYLWNFADPASGISNTSNLVNPNHIFTTAGINTVKLVIVNNKGCSDSVTKSITVQPSPKAQFSTSLTCEKQKVFFTDLSTIVLPGVIQSYSTNFGDASGVVSIKNPSHTYNIIGPYSVKYIVTANNGCPDTSISTLNIYSKPIPKFGITGPFCVNSAIGFNDSSIVNGSSINSWTWTFDGSQNSPLKNTVNAFASSGSHTAKLLISSLQGCKDSLAKSFTINVLPTAAFTYSPTYGDPPLNVSFTNQSSAGVIGSSWDFGDASPLSALLSPSHIFQDSGTYAIKLTVTDNNSCMNTTTKNFQIQYALYDVALLLVQADVDADNFLNITLNFGNASTRPLTSVDFIVDIDGDNGFKEAWTGNLNIGGITSYTLKASPRLNTTSAHNYICVTAKKPDGFPDIRPSDNEICAGLKSNGFVLPDPNPNPVTDYMIIPLIMPADEEIELSVYNKMGQKINDTYKYAAIKGYNSVTFYTGNLASGVYTYMVSYKNNTAVKKFVKLSN
jgi:PKD repeat protein